MEMIHIFFVIYVIVSIVGIVMLVNKKQEEVYQLKSLFEYEKNQKAILEEKLNSLNELKENYERLKEENIKLNSSLKEGLVKYEELQKQITEKNRQNETLNEELKKLRDENSKLHSSFKESLAKYEELQKQIVEKNRQNETLNKELKELRDINSKLFADYEKLKAEIIQKERSFEEKIALIKNSEEKLKESFENLANEIFEKANEKIKKSSQENLSIILNPLQIQIKEFKEKVEDLNLQESKKLSALENELKHLKELNIKLSEEANNLTKALKGDKKIQGTWGELVLERVLELSGLRKGIEYEREVYLKDGEKGYRPDVIIHLPNNKDVIIDAKTSLNAYIEYIKTEDKIFLIEHIKNLKNHIDILASKKYENLKGVNSLDFVFMFIPIENVLTSALEYDSSLFEYAFKKRVILVSPTTLLVSLRAIESSWRFERQAKNIEEVVKTAENLYDKVRLFLEEFDKVGNSIEKAHKSFENAKSKLTTGRGNVLRQIELLKEKAGIKPKKEIPQGYIDVALIE